jgi:type II secretory pathway pseudopilin PulG
MLELPGYRFEPSRAGHSSARIDQLFTQLRDRQRELGDASDAELVAAVGDDEQFVVAAMLLADQLGFNARIALGTALQRSGDAANSAVAVCDSGACTGANLTAWLEVQGDSGAWVAVDVTPQFENPIAPDRDRLQDPQVPTEVQPPSVESVQPPESEPSQRDADSSDPDANPLNLAWLWLTLQVIGVLLLIALILFGPLLAIVLLKASRRANRRRSLEPKESVLGAWNEFVDTAVDAGSAPPRNETRSEFVERQPRAEDNTELLSLAQLADRAVFSAELSSTQQRDQAWHIVDEHRAVSRAALNRRQRLLAILSLRSFLRFLRGGCS